MNPKIKLYIILFFLFAACVAVASRINIPSASQTPAGNGRELRVAFLDIGQGDAILLTTPHNHHILIDGGPDNTVLTRLGEEMPFYDRTIDLVITSHNHADHITGLNSVLDRYTVQKMWISGAIHTTNEYISMLQKVKDHSIPTEIVWKGKTTDVDGVHLEVLHPIMSNEGQRPPDQHDATVVVKANYGQKSFLFTGDLNEEHEQKMLDAGANLTANVLKVPHHGSSTGLLPAFLDVVHPEYAVIQVGAKNKYGHPTQAALQKLQARNIPFFRNDTQGTIMAVTDGKNLTITPRK